MDLLFLNKEPVLFNQCHLSKNVIMKIHIVIVKIALSSASTLNKAPQRCSHIVGLRDSYLHLNHFRELNISL